VTTLESARSRNILRSEAAPRIAKMSDLFVAHLGYLAVERQEPRSRLGPGPNRPGGAESGVIH
jgi:hypothetical protein